MQSVSVYGNRLHQLFVPVFPFLLFLLTDTLVTHTIHTVTDTLD